MVAQAYKLNKISFIKKRLFITLCFISSLFLSSIVQAQTLRLISDEETELFLADILRPIYQTENIPFNRDKVFIVQDPSLNAFVGDGNNMFVHTGTLVSADNYNQLEGVLAHEAGHIQGGHILRLKIKSKQLQNVSMVSLIAAGIAGAVSGRADVGMAVVLGSQTSALHNITRYQMQEERSADEAALSILTKLKKSPEGLLGFMKKIQQQNMLSGIEETPYFRTHPITSERVAFLTEAAKKSPFSPNQALSHRFEMIKAKLIAFLYKPEAAKQLYPANNNSMPALYAHAILNLREFKIEAAIRDINALIEKEPNNPFFWELKGQIYFESGQIHNARLAYQKTHDLLPNSPAFQLNLAQAMLEDSPSPKEIETIISLLNKSLVKSKNAYAWLMLAQAYGMQDNMAYANYASAEFSLFIGEVETAQKQVSEAKKLNPPSALQNKLSDIEKRIEQILKKRNSF